MRRKIRYERSGQRNSKYIDFISIQAQLVLGVLGRAALRSSGHAVSLLDNIRYKRCRYSRDGGGYTSGRLLGTEAIHDDVLHRFRCFLFHNWVHLSL